MTTGEVKTLTTLREEIRSVRNAIIEILMRMDDITLHRLPQIRADYALKIGCWEQALLEAELAGRRARRKLALAQTQANRGEVPQMERIEAQLDDELADWMTKIRQAQLTYEQALSYITGTRPLSKSESAQLKTLYRTLVKRLHPDVCSSDEHEMLFLLAQAAYRNGDVLALRSMEVATRHLEREDDLEVVDDPAPLELELELARIEEGVMRERLHELESSEELGLAELLANPKWVSTRTTELRRAVEEWERVRDDCTLRLRELRESFNGR